MTEDGRHIKVPEEAKKHLSRNIPLNFAAYCRHVAERRLRRRNSLEYKVRAVLPRDRTEIANLCLGGDADSDAQAVIASKIFDISVVYEALQTSVDHTISSKAFSKEMKRMIHNLKSVRRALSDDVRDRNVMELLGHNEAGELDVSEDAFEKAETLAHKAAIVSGYVDQTLFRLENMAEHFDYKSGLYGGGIPAKYAFEYAIHALGAIFEDLNTVGHKASVSEITPEQSSSGHHSYEYDSPFLRFVKAFFRIFDTDQIENREGQGFGDAVRKSARRYQAVPDLHRLLHGDSTAQHVIDFMIGVDQVK